MPEVTTRWLALPIMFLTYTASVLASSSANAAGVSSGRMYVMVREPEAFKKIQNRPESTTL